MSGFFGIFSPTNKVDRVAFGQMLEYARKGSFDEVDTMETDQISMGHMMLRVSPEAEYDQQPLQSYCGRYLLTGHFRLDYRDELGDKLGFGFDELKKMPDSLLALLAFQKWKENCVHHLEGDWAFVLHDKKENELFMAKDKTGVSALFHIKFGEQVFFASDTATILSVISKDVEIDHGVFFRYAQLGTYPEGGQTLINGLHYVNNAEQIIYDFELNKKANSYWDLENIPPVRFRFEEDYVHGLFSVYSAAIRSRLHTDKEIGLFLSGGLDSTSVASLAALELQTKGRTLNTYTSFPHYESLLPVSDKIMANEVPLVQDLVKRYKNLRPHFFDFPNSSLKDQFDEAQALDAYYPIISKNSFWVNGILKEARGKCVKRILTGQLGNYTITWRSTYVYTALLLQFRSIAFFNIILRDFQASGEKLPSFIAGYVLRPIKARFSFIFFGRKQVDQHATSYLDYTQLRHTKNRKNKIFDTIFRLRKFFNGANDDRKDRLYNLIPFVGTRWSIEAKGNGLEVTDPTADSRLIDFSFSIPVDLFFRPGSPKFIFKRMMSGIIPNNILTNIMIKVQAQDFVFRIKYDEKFHTLFKNEISNYKFSSPMNLYMLDKFFDSVIANPEGFRQAPSLQIFLNVFALHRFFERIH